jgi:hypothetical protein
LHVDAELLERLGALGELDGKEDVGRFVDQIARQINAVRDCEPLLSGCARGDGMARADNKIGRLGAVVLRFLPARFVFVEPVGAQAEAKRKIGRRRAVPGSRRSLECNLDALRARRISGRPGGDDPD